MKITATFVILAITIAVTSAQFNSFNRGASRFPVPVRQPVRQRITTYTAPSVSGGGGGGGGGSSGAYRPDNSGSYNDNDGRYRPDSAGSYVHQDAGYNHQDAGYRHTADKFGGSGGGGGGGGGAGGAGGFGGSGSGGGFAQNNFGGGNSGSKPGSGFPVITGAGASSRPGSSAGSGSASSGSGSASGSSAFGSGGSAGFGHAAGGRKQISSTLLHSLTGITSHDSSSGSGISGAAGYGAPVALQQGSAAGKYDNRNYGIIRQTGHVEEDGYNYLYETENGITGEEQGKLANRETDNEGMRSSGYYTYTGPDNVVYTVNYTADENGFVPEAAHIPTPPPVPEYILRALDYQRSIGTL